jgi:hypothetical protein
MKNELKKVLSLFAFAWRFAAANRRLALYVSFFALSGGIFNLVRRMPSYLEYLNFYNPFWSGFSLGNVFSFKVWSSVVLSSFREVASLSGLLGDLAYLSSANLISIGVLIAALFFSSRLRNLFRGNDFAWQVAFFSFGGTLLFLPLYWVFSSLLPIAPIALILAVAESLSLSVFLVVLLTFFEGIFLFSMKFRLSGESYDRDKVCEEASRVFRSLFIFNLIWAFLNPINFSGLFSLPAFLSYIVANVPSYPLLSSIIWWLQKFLVAAFLSFSTVFIFVPLSIVLEPALGVVSAMKKSLSVFKESAPAAIFLLLGGVVCQAAADFSVSLFSRGLNVFGFGEMISFAFREVLGPIAYAFALLIFAAATMKFLKEKYYSGLNGGEGEDEISRRLPPPNQE